GCPGALPLVEPGDLRRRAGTLPVVEPRHGRGTGDIGLLVTARGVQRGTRHRRLGVLVAPAGYTLLLVTAGQFGVRTSTARRELRRTAALGVAAVRRDLAPAATEDVLAVLLAVRTRGLHPLRGAGRPEAGTRAGTRAGGRGTAL